MSGPHILGHDEVRAMAETGAQLVEVLPREEYDWAHLPGAVSLPLREIDEKAATTLDRSAPVITYCNDFL